MSYVKEFMKNRRAEIDQWLAENADREQHEISKLRQSTPMPDMFLDNIIGQTNAKTLLQLATERAIRRGAALRHILLTGPAGVGKSTLAIAVANEVNASLHQVLGVELANSAKFDAMIRFILSRNMNRIVFIDEIHNTPKKIQERLYTPMQDFFHEGKELLPFTVIGATTDQGKLLRPMRDRFTYSIEVEPYTEEDLTKIVKVRFPLYDDAIAEFIAKRSKGVARLAIEHSKVIEDVSQGDGAPVPTLDHAMFAMAVSRINPDGLCALDLHILITLAKAGRPMSKNTLASVVDVSPDDLEVLYEPFMIKQGLIVKTPRGREITDKGRGYLQANVKSSLEIGVKEILEVTNV